MFAMETLTTPTNCPNPSQGLSHYCPPAYLNNALLSLAHRKDQHGTNPNPTAFAITRNTGVEKVYLRYANPTPPQVRVPASPPPELR
jgi:hypothetical protein